MLVVCTCIFMIIIYVVKPGKKLVLKHNFCRWVILGQHYLNKAHFTQFFNLLCNGPKCYLFIMKLCINVVSGPQFTTKEKIPKLSSYSFCETHKCKMVGLIWAGHLTL